MEKKSKLLDFGDYMLIWFNNNINAIIIEEKKNYLFFL